MLEVHDLKRVAAGLRQELAHALYKDDACMRVLARVTRERDEAREALANVRATMGLQQPSSANGGGGDVEMSEAPTEDAPALTGEFAELVQKTNDACVPSLTFAHLS